MLDAILYQLGERATGGQRGQTIDPAGPRCQIFEAGGRRFGAVRQDER